MAGDSSQSDPAPKPVPRDAGWPAHLRHNPDPNRVPRVQVTSPAAPGPRHTAAHGPPVAPYAADAPRPQQQRQEEPSYYDVPMLKAPVWKWMIPVYFFLGGLSGGAYLLSRIARRFGGRGRTHREDADRAARTAAAVAVAAVIPCAPLLIADLGDMKRFHHMLRVWKPTSPMNLGTWVLTAYAPLAVLTWLDEWARTRARHRDHTALGRIARTVRVASAPLGVAADVAGVPLGLLLTSYTGVLLTNTATPVWSQNPWLPALFAASAVGSAAAATDLALDAQGVSPDAPAREALAHVDTAAHAAEAATLAGYLRRAGPLAAPLTKGPMRHHLWLAAAGLVASEALKHAPLRAGRARRAARLAGSAIGLAGAFSLRLAIAGAGRPSGNDPHAARLSSRPAGATV